MTRALIIDDEAHNRETLEQLLERHCPGVTVVGMASGVQSGIQAIRGLHPDLVFLDINMADGTGFDLVQALEPVNFKVIFVSAMDKSTIRAFKLSDMEYLQKPVSIEMLKKAVSRVLK